MEDKAVLILAGGKGSRIGGKKYKVNLNSLPLILHVYSRLKRLEIPIYISVKDQAQAKEIKMLFKDKGINLDEEMFIYDALKGIEGPLAGIASAMLKLESSHKQSLLVVATDQPFIEPSFLNWLIKISETSPQKVFICKKEEKMEPFPGIYPCALKKTLINFLNTSPKKSLYRFFLYLREAGLICFLQNCDTIAIKSFFNINTHEDLKLAQRCFFQSSRNQKT
jgi:molybdopterin-guanine dinucleotide biosynthesis protein A